MGIVYPSAFAANLPANFAEDDETTAADGTDINAFLSADPRIGGVYQSALAAKQQRLDLAKANAGQMWQNYRDQLTQERVGPTKLERIASALTAFGAAPTRKGNFFEALNAANKNMLETGAEAAAADRSRKKMLNELAFKQAQDLAEREEAGASGIDALQLQAIKTLGAPAKRAPLVPVQRDALGSIVNGLTGRPFSPGKNAVNVYGEEVNTADYLNDRYPSAGAAMGAPAGGPAGAPTGVTTGARAKAAPTQPVPAAVGAPQGSAERPLVYRAKTLEDAATQKVGTQVILGNKSFTMGENGLIFNKDVPVDTSAAETADARAMARQLNIPYNPAPMPKFQTPAKQDAYLAAVAQSGLKNLEIVDANVESTRSIAYLAKEFLALNANNITGAFTGNVPAIAQSTDMRQMNLINEQIAPLVPKNPGAVSNFEAVKIGNSTLSPKNPKAVNEAVARRYIAFAALSAEQQQFLNKWRDVHDGSTQGANAVWSRYLKENPVFDPKYLKDARPVQGRMSYDEWANKTYYSPQKPAARPAAPKAAPAPNAPVVKGGKVQYWGRDKNGNPVLLERPKS